MDIESQNPAAQDMVKILRSIDSNLQSINDKLETIIQELKAM